MARVLPQGTRPHRGGLQFLGKYLKSNLCIQPPWWTFPIYIRNMIDDGEIFILRCVKTHKIIGIISYLKFSRRRIPQEAEILVLAIRKLYRNKGYGRFLVNHTLEKIQGKFQTVILGSMKDFNVKEFYLKLGFQIYEENSKSYRFLKEL